MTHTTDRDCTLDHNDICVECGVWHGDPCPSCGGRGFHLDSCPEMDSTMVKIVYRNEAGQIVGYLSRNYLMATKPENACEVEPGNWIHGLINKAHRLLDGPHPFDHLGPLTVGTEPKDW